MSQWKKARNCYWCGNTVSYRQHEREAHFAATREHLIPKSLGGGSGSNIVVACRGCNEARGRRTDWVPYHVHLGNPPEYQTARKTLPPKVQAAISKRERVNAILARVQGRTA